MGGGVGVASSSVGIGSRGETASVGAGGGGVSVAGWGGGNVTAGAQEDKKERRKIERRICLAGLYRMDAILTKKLPPVFGGRILRKR